MSCAAALTVTKELIRTNNAVFGLSFIGRSVVLYVMWMAGTVEETQFIMSSVWYARLERDEYIFQLMEVLMNVHNWAHTERRAEIAEALVEEVSATRNGTPRLPVILAPAVTDELPQPTFIPSTVVGAARQQQRTTDSNDSGISGSTRGGSRGKSRNGGTSSTANAAANDHARTRGNRGNSPPKASTPGATRRLRSVGLEDN
ncbi:hypothetical protein F4804DRAFT_339288 [Jackrogersella minutella]|nr:hypothetical protein F4804DRAFT_339288 [Jackrogersella minutella]